MSGIGSDLRTGVNSPSQHNNSEPIEAENPATHRQKSTGSSHQSSVANSGKLDGPSPFEQATLVANLANVALSAAPDKSGNKSPDLPQWPTDTSAGSFKRFMETPVVYSAQGDAAAISKAAALEALAEMRPAFPLPQGASDKLCANMEFGTKLLQKIFLMPFNPSGQELEAHRSSNSELHEANDANRGIMRQRFLELCDSAKKCLQDGGECPPLYTDNNVGSKAHNLDNEMNMYWGSNLEQSLQLPLTSQLSKFAIEIQSSGSQAVMDLGSKELTQLALLLAGREQDHPGAVILSAEPNDNDTRKFRSTADMVMSPGPAKIKFSFMEAVEHHFLVLGTGVASNCLDDEGHIKPDTKDRVVVDPYFRKVFPLSMAADYIKGFAHTFQGVDCFVGGLGISRGLHYQADDKPYLENAPVNSAEPFYQKSGTSTFNFTGKP